MPSPTGSEACPPTIDFLETEFLFGLAMFTVFRALCSPHSCLPVWVKLPIFDNN